MSPITQEASNLGGKLRFDGYEAEPRVGELRKHGVRIPLEDRPFRALLILLRRANEVVTREELKRQLWTSDVFIDFDHGLNTAIRKVRLALNDSADKPRFVETIGRRGYRFMASVSQDASVVPEQARPEAQSTEAAIEAPGAQNDLAIAETAAAPSPQRSFFRRRAMIIAAA